MRDYFLFYRSFFEAIQSLPPDIQIEIYPTLVAYALDGTLPPENISPLARSIFLLAKPIIDASNSRRDNGCRGGAPKGNQNARKKTTKNNQKQPKVEITKQPKNNQKQPNNIYYNILSSSNEESNNYNNNNIDVELNKFNINNNEENSVDADDVAEMFFLKISNKDFLHQATSALSISSKEFLRHAKAIISEWKLSAPYNFLEKNTPVQHLINQVRIKRDSPAEKKAQSSFREMEISEQRKKTLEKEDSTPRGQAALEEYLRSKGLPSDSNIVTLINNVSEIDALNEYRALNPQ